MRVEERQTRKECSCYVSSLKLRVSNLDRATTAGLVTAHSKIKGTAGELSLCN